MNILLILTITLSNSIVLIKSDYESGGWMFSDVTHSLYQVFPKKLGGYQSAVNFCQNLNSSLVVIDSPAEFIWLRDYVNTHTTVFPWVGATADSCKNFKWNAVNSSNIIISKYGPALDAKSNMWCSTVNWKHNEQPDCYDNTQLNVVIVSGSDLNDGFKNTICLDDVHCNDQYAPLCEK